MKGLITMKLIHAEYTRCITASTLTTIMATSFGLTVIKQNSEYKPLPIPNDARNALAIDNPLEYARLVLDGEMPA